MRICALSDLHGTLPEVPDCDLLLLGGDYCPNSNLMHFWYGKQMAPWLEELATRMKIVGVGGNHDELFEKHPDLVPKMEWTYLQDKLLEWNGLRIWGSPWQLRFYDWAFNLMEDQLERKWELIPDDTDILITHSPPYGYGDLAEDFQTKKSEHVGSPSLMGRIMEVSPKLCVFGHIHAGRGVYQIDGKKGPVVLANATIMNDEYKPVYKPMVFDYDNGLVTVVQK